MKLVAGIAVACLSLGPLSVAAQDAAAPNSATTAPAGPTSAAPSPTIDAEPGAGGHIAPPPPGKAQVVFFRTGAYMGAIYSPSVREDKTVLGTLPNQSYFVATLEPGVHTFSSRTENTSHIRLELDPGETYYVRETLSMGLITMEVNLAPADAAMFDLHYAHLHARKSDVASD